MRTCSAGHDLDVVGEYVYPYSRTCKECQRANSRRYSKTDGARALRRARAAQTRAQARQRQMVRAYGVTAEAFAEMTARQGGVCAICGSPETARSTVGGTRRLSIDHDHDTGQVRGLLCSACNRGLGLLGDDLALIEAAQRYLQSWFPR